MALDIEQGVNIDTYLSLGSAVVTSTPLTIATHFNTSQVTGYIVCIEDGTSREGWALGALSSQVRAVQSNGIFNSSAYSTDTFTANTWNHWAGVFESNASRYAYLNGIAGAQDTFNPGTPSGLTTTLIGTSYNTLGDGFFFSYTGCIANVAIWSAALTADEIAALSAGVPPPLIRPASLVFFAPLLSDDTKLINERGSPLTANTGSGTLSDCSSAPLIVSPTFVADEATTQTLAPASASALDRKRAWAFDLDGHTFYVLSLGEEGTFLYDVVTGMWSQFVTDGYDGVWNMVLGIMWQNRIIGAHVTSAKLWELDPTAVIDEEATSINHAVTGGLQMRSRNAKRNDAFRIMASAGKVEEDGALVRLRFSDDHGNTWSDMGTIALEDANYSQELAWLSLGAMQAPGRVYEITDAGGNLRIDGADAIIEGVDEDGSQG